MAKKTTPIKKLNAQQKKAMFGNPTKSDTVKEEAPHFGEKKEDK